MLRPKHFSLWTVVLTAAFAVGGVAPFQAAQGPLDELAARLIAARGEAERAAMLDAQKTLLSADLADAVDRAARRFLENRDAAQAQAAFQVERELSVRLQRPELEARALHGLGSAQAARNNYAGALDFFQQSLRISDNRSKSELGAVLSDLANAYYRQNDYVSAIEYSVKAREIYEELKDLDRVAAVLTTTGVIQRAQGDLDGALESYRKAESILEKTGNRSEYRRLTNSMGIVLRYQGNFGLALEYTQKSLTAAQEMGSKAGVADALMNVGNLYRQQNNAALALDSYQKAAAMYEELDDKEFLARTLANIGITYKQTESYGQAREFYQRSLQLAQSLKRGELIAGLQVNLGSLQALDRAFPQALQNFQESLAFYEASGVQYIAAGVLTNIGRVYYDQKDYPQALVYSGRAAAIAEEIGGPNLLAEVYDLIARTYFALGNDSSARQAWEKEIAAVETVRSLAAGGDQDRQRVLEVRLSPWSGMVRLLVKQNKPFEALTFAEQARGRVLLDVLQSGRTDIQKAMDAGEREQERKLRDALAALNRSLTAAVQSDKPDRRRIDELKTEIAKARLAYEAFQLELYAKHPELRIKRGQAPTIKLAELASLLTDPKTAFLEYAVTDETTYLFAMTRASGASEVQIRAYTLPVGRDEIAKQTQDFRDQLAGRNLAFRGAARNLYQLLLEPAAAQLAGKTNLVIVPDDQLWDLPFQALLTQDNRYLIETRAVSYTPSLTVLSQVTTQRKSQQVNRGPANLFAIGNPMLEKRTIQRAALTLRDEKLSPLPEAEGEVKALGQLYGAARSTVYVGANAREDRVKAEAGRAGILHFATHGTLNNPSPMYSNLVLAQGVGNEDGLLEAWELMQLDLKADLAVLSACESARGRFGAGEGMIGLTWALFVAGVPSTLVSQWQVESASTRDLMVQFHRSFKTGSDSKAESLRQAALKLMKSSQTSHPFYWAGFVLVGDGR